MTLEQYLRDNNDSPYQLYIFDCLIFTNACWEILYGQPWCPDWLQSYQECSSVLDVGYPTVEEAIGSRMIESPRNYGSLVALPSPNAQPLGYALGICLGDKSVFVGSKGLLYLPTKLIKLSWK